LAARAAIAGSMPKWPPMLSSATSILFADQAMSLKKAVSPLW
jgi:hypothetical protein